MAAKAGRPKKNIRNTDAKKRLTDAAVAIIKRDGAGCVTVRNVTEEAGLSTGTFYHHFKNKDDLMVYFVKTSACHDCDLHESLTNISARITELYLHLTDRYKELGRDFMKCFYTTDNKALSAYMSESNGGFLPDTVMFRCEQELEAAKKNGVLRSDADTHLMSMDICTIVKGCVFEWCLSDGNMELEDSLGRIMDNYFLVYMK